MQSTNFIGAYSRGETIGQALDKFPKDVARYVMLLLGTQLSTNEAYEVNVVQEKEVVFRYTTLIQTYFLIWKNPRLILTNIVLLYRLP